MTLTEALWRIRSAAALAGEAMRPIELPISALLELSRVLGAEIGCGQWIKPDGSVKICGIEFVPPSAPSPYVSCSHWGLYERH